MANAAAKNDTTTAHKKYVLRTFLFMAGYAAALTAALSGAFDDVQAPGAYLLGLAVAAPIAGQIWATLMLIRDSDEFMRGVMAKRFIIAAGLAMALFTAWGFVEMFSDLPHVQGWWIYPLFWTLMAVITPFVRDSH